MQATIRPCVGANYCLDRIYTKSPCWRPQTSTLADRERVLAERPDVVIIATGGLLHTQVLTSGNEYADSTWAVISGAKLEIRTPDRSLAPEVMAMNLVPFINHGTPARWVVLRPQGRCDEPRRGGR
jgi:hypothetical protein